MTDDLDTQIAEAEKELATAPDYPTRRRALSDRSPKARKTRELHARTNPSTGEILSPEDAAKRAAVDLSGKPTP